MDTKDNDILIIGGDIAAIALIFIILDLIFPYNNILKGACIFFFFCLVFFGVKRLENRDDEIRSLQLKYILKFDVILYLVLFDFIYFILRFGYYFFWPENSQIFYNCSSSSLDLLTSIVQSEAAIIAIVVSLTFVAVTLTADKYSFRTNEIFKRIFPDTWILLSIYSITIIYGLFLLNGHIIPHHDDLFFITSLAVYSLICLFLYSWNVLSILRPENIAALYSYKIDPEYKPYKRDRLRKEDLSDDESGYILAIFDIMKNSIKKDDPNAVYATITYLKTLVERILDGYPKTVEYPDLRLKYISSLMKKTKIEHGYEIDKMFKNYSPDINRYVDIWEGIDTILIADTKKIIRICNIIFCEPN